MKFSKITSAQNPEIKKITLWQSKNQERKKAQVIILEGEHLFQEILKHKLESINGVFISEKKQSIFETQIPKFLSKKAVLLPERLIKKITQTKTDCGILTIAQNPKPQEQQKINSAFLLDRIQNPGNLGTLIRSAAASGIEALFLSSGCVDPWSAKVLRAGMGAHFRVKIFTEINLAQWIEHFPGSVYALDMGGLSLFETPLNKKSAFLLGSEGLGLDKNMIKKCDQKISIPMQNQIDSLNVGITGSLCGYEYFRQTV